jgi:isopenicillin N synthase-like dioxygenase
MSVAESMTEESPWREIPVLDMGPLLAGTPGAQEKLAADLRRACTDIGFFYVANHGVPQELVDSVFAQVARFHARPLEEKLKLKINRDNIGYLPMAASTVVSTTIETNNKPAQNEALFVKNEPDPNDPRLHAGVEFYGNNQWPEEMPGFRETILDYCDQLNTLALRLLPAYSQAMDMPADWLPNHPAFAAPLFRLRMSHYPPRPDFANDGFGAPPHTDYGFLTILAQSEVPGLEIRNRDGSWLKAPVMPGHFLVNTADICMRLSNDRLVSTPHRVVNASPVDRYAIPFFWNPAPECELAVAPSCIAPGDHAHYEPFTYGGYFRMRITKNYHHQNDKDGAGKTG